MESLYNLLQTRRSIRKYKPATIEPEKIQTILKAALMSPASKRSNPWDFIVVDDKSMLEKLSTCKPHGAAFLKDAPLAIVVCANPEKSDVWTEDTSIASIIIQLMAHDLGLGSCWIQIRKRNFTDDVSAEQHIQNLLNIPQNIAIESIISIGYPDETRAGFDESKLLKERLHLNSFGKNFSI